MKTYILTLAGCLIVGGIAHAGPIAEATNSLQMPSSQPRSTWYAAEEWDVDLFSAYAFTNTRYTSDRYLDADHAFGVGLAAKYFFARYFGVGIEGFLLDARRTSIDREGAYFLSVPPRFYGVETRTKDARSVGSVLGTLTFRYPIAQSRFAPYAFVGGGGIFGGGEQDRFIYSIDPRIPNTVSVTTRHTDSTSRFVAQAGAGFEIRLTPRFGITNDFTWSVVEGAHNDFGMVRSAINYAF